MTSSSFFVFFFVFLLSLLLLPLTSPYSLPRLLSYSRSNSRGSLTYCVETIERSLSSYLPYSNYKPSVVPDYEELLDVYLRAATRLIKYKEKATKPGKDTAGWEGKDIDGGDNALKVPYR